MKNETLDAIARDFVLDDQLYRLLQRCYDETIILDNPSTKASISTFITVLNILRKYELSNE